MGKCEVCGNEYEHPIQIKVANEVVTHEFDCFECAVHALAPHCQQCGVRIMGHGVQVANEIYCGAHCARRKGYQHLIDHVDVELAMSN